MISIAHMLKEMHIEIEKTLDSLIEKIRTYYSDTQYPTKKISSFMFEDTNGVSMNICIYNNDQNLTPTPLTHALETIVSVVMYTPVGPVKVTSTYKYTTINGMQRTSSYLLNGMDSHTSTLVLDRLRIADNNSSTSAIAGDETHIAR